MTTMADRLIEAMTRSAARQYGQERVNELAHALQCAELADAAGADEELVLACLLHDVGRYAWPRMASPTRSSARPRHRARDAAITRPARILWRRTCRNASPSSSAPTRRRSATSVRASPATTIPSPG